MSPESNAFAFLECDLLASSAWRARSINAARLIDFLIIEHRNHGGFENGNLNATFDQLWKFGLSRQEIPGAIRECVYLGLMVVQMQGGKNIASRYRLTFYATLSDQRRPTNDWRQHDGQKVRDLREAVKKAESLVRKPVPTKPRLVRKPVPTAAPEQRKSAPVVGTGFRTPYILPSPSSKKKSAPPPRRDEIQAGPSRLQFGDDFYDDLRGDGNG